LVVAESVETASVLIAEDDPQLRKGIVRVVRRAFVPVECGSYEQALAAIDRMTQRPRAMIVDVHLGSSRGGDGIDVAAYAQHQFGVHIPTLVLTGHGSVAHLTARAHSIRAVFLYKPQNAETLHLFLERAKVNEAWDVPEVLDLDRALTRFSSEHALTKRQTRFLFTLMRAAERGERPELNPNTRKAALRRILAKSGHASFEEIRAVLKQAAGCKGTFRE
jgi:DNA-binding NtrC family response regulator